jgi:hypothetical protein
MVAGSSDGSTHAEKWEDGMGLHWMVQVVVHNLHPRLLTSKFELVTKQGGRGNTKE